VLTRHGRPDVDGVRYLAGDLATGDGVADAVDGVGTIIHCAGRATGDDELTRTLVRAVRSRGGAPHLVYQRPRLGHDPLVLASYFGLATT
jgi:hypothetical protein